MFPQNCPAHFVRYRLRPRTAREPILHFKGLQHQALAPREAHPKHVVSDTCLHTANGFVFVACMGHEIDDDLFSWSYL